MKIPYIFMVNRFNGKSRTFIVITASLNDQQGKVIAKKIQNEHENEQTNDGD